MSMSKCMKNFVQGQESAMMEAKKQYEDDSVAKSMEVGDILAEVGGKCIVSTGLPASYAEQCQTLTSMKEFQQNSSYLVDFNNGRLGNQLSSFASVYGLSKVTGLRPLLTHRCHTALTTYFTGVSWPVLERTFCSPCDSLTFQPLPSSPSPQGKIYTPAAAYSNLIPAYAPILPQLRKTLTFREKFVTAAQEQLRQARKATQKRNPIYVGVHNRRGDYGSHMESYGEHLVGPTYFEGALKLMRNTLEDPVFMVVSDDIPWAKKHIAGEDVFYSTSGTNSSLSVGADLALLASCNHTIITYGTFGLWGALLSGGATIMSTRAKVLQRLLGQAGLSNFVFLDEEEDWRRHQEVVRDIVDADKDGLNV